MKKVYRNAIIITAVAVLGIWGLWKIIPDGSNTTSDTTNNTGAQIELVSSNSVKAGKNTFTVSVKDAAGEPVDDAIVNVDINMTAMDMGKQQGQATFQGDGEYAVVGNLGMLGPWRIATDVTLPDGQEISEDFTVMAK